MEPTIYYKISCIVAGLIIVVIGAILLVILQKAKLTSIQVSAKGWLGVKILQASPGIIVILFGLLVIFSTILKGYKEWRHERVQQSANPASQLSTAATPESVALPKAAALSDKTEAKDKKPGSASPDTFTREWDVKTEGSVPQSPSHSLLDYSRNTL